MFALIFTFISKTAIPFVFKTICGKAVEKTLDVVGTGVKKGLTGKKNPNIEDVSPISKKRRTVSEARKKICVDGGSIIIRNGKITHDNKNVDSYDANTTIIQIIGNIHEVDSDAPLTVNGKVGMIIAKESITCGDVKGNIDSRGSVICDNITGNVTAGGDVECNSVGGSVKSKAKSFRNQ